MKSDQKGQEMLKEGVYLMRYRGRKSPEILQMQMRDQELIFSAVDHCLCSQGDGFDDCPLCSAPEENPSSATSSAYASEEDTPVKSIKSAASGSLSRGASLLFYRSKDKIIGIGSILKISEGHNHPLFLKSARFSDPSHCFLLEFRRKSLALAVNLPWKRDAVLQAIRSEKSKVGDSNISTPFNLNHLTHVNTDLEWTLRDLERMFDRKELIGTGSYGKVYKAIDTKNNVTFAVKTIPLSFFQEMIGSEFLNVGKSSIDLPPEVEHLKKLRHSNIVNFYGVWGPDSHDQIWILMDHCYFGSLSDILPRSQNRLKEEQLAWVAKCTLNGLSFLHEHSVLHRDIKPSNILVELTGNCKIADFGVALELRKSVSVVKERQIKGTPLYLAPEVMQKGETRKASDLWALGIALVELANGSNPYEDRAGFAGITAIQNSELPELKEHPGETWSAEFKDFLAQILKSNAAERPTSQELLQHPFVKNATIHSMEEVVVLRSKSLNRKDSEKLLNAYQRALKDFQQMDLFMRRRVKPLEVNTISSTFNSAEEVHSPLIQSAQSRDRDREEEEKVSRCTFCCFIQ